MSEGLKTLNDVRARLSSWYGGSEACLDVKTCDELESMIKVLDDHLATPSVPLDQFGRVGVLCPSCMGSKAKWCFRCANSGEVRMTPSISKGKEA